MSIFLWNLVKKRTFGQKWCPLKKKGQNASFRELKDEKGRVDSPETGSMLQLLKDQEVKINHILHL